MKISCGLNIFRLEASLGRREWRFVALEKNVKSLVHFMAYPGPGTTKSVMRGEARASYLLRSIEEIISDPYFGAIEITTIKDPSLRAEVAKRLKDAKFQIIWSAQPVQLLNEDDLVPVTDISSIDELHRIAGILRLKRCIDEAYEVGATSLGLISGRDPGTEAGTQARKEAIQALIRSLDELCTYSKEVAAARGVSPLTISLEMFDRSPEPGHKNQLIGPADDAIFVAREVRDTYGHKEFGLLYDLSHMLLLRGNSFVADTPRVLRRLAPYLNHIHIGSCVIDKEDPLYGDSHPPFDYPGSAVGEKEMAAFVGTLADIGYTGGIGFEVTPLPDQEPSNAVDSVKTAFNSACNRTDVNYAIGGFHFHTRRWFPDAIFNMITETRVQNPGLIQEAAASRKRRPTLTLDGKLVILAADHPARYVTNVGSNPTGMGDRLDYLGRIVRVVAGDEIDGVMGTPDIIEDLLILHYLSKEKGGPGFLDGKVLLGCMNRGGLAGIEYEMDDRMTAFTAESMHKLGLDGAKMMFRVDVGRMSRYSVQTITYCANAINECNKYGLPVFIEPLPVEPTPSGYKVIMDPDELIKTMGVAAALGDSSANLWLKIPYVPDYHRVAKASTLPILMLGGASKGNPIYTIEDFARGMGEGHNVRGAMVGRNVLYPGLDDPRAVAAAVYKVVHDEVSALSAVKHLAEVRGTGMDEFKQWLGLA